MFKRNLSLLIITGFLVVIEACSGKNDKRIDITEKPIEVTLATPVAGNQSAISASGEVEAVQTANISTRQMGRITHIYVKVGDNVSKGQILVRVWDEDIKAKIAQADAMIAEAESAYLNAQKDYDRFNNLYKQQSATAKELDNVSLQYNSAKSKLDAARQMRNEISANLSYNNLIAPFAGVVTQKSAEVGSIASPGMPLLTIEQNGILQVSAKVAESDISSVHLGDIANMQIRSTGKFLVGRIIQINPSSQFTGGQYIVKISIPENARKDIYAGMFTSLSIPVKNSRHEKSEMPLVPLAAITNRDELTGIYTVSLNNTALLRWIRLGKNLGDKVEVISGLSGNEKFIVSSESRLYNGAPVVVKEVREESMSTASR